MCMCGLGKRTTGISPEIIGGTEGTVDLVWISLVLLSVFFEAEVGSL